MIKVVAIFAFAVRDSVGNHDWWLVVPAYITLAFLCWQSWETRRSAKAAEKSAEAALLNAQALVNAERSWILAELGWWENQPTRIALTESKEGDGPIVSSITANLKLICRNEGKSPAWVDKIYGRMDVVSTRAEIKKYDRQECGNLGLMEAIPAGGERAHSFRLEGDGRLENGAFLSVYVIIDYHDVFGHPRETTIGYSLGLGGNLNRQDAIVSRNRNT